MRAVVHFNGARVLHLGENIGRRARVTLVLTSLAGLFPLASYLARYAPDSLDRHYQSANAPNVEAVREIYLRNDWPGMQAEPCQDPPDAAGSSGRSDGTDEDSADFLALRDAP